MKKEFVKRPIFASKDRSILGPYAKWYKVATLEDLAEFGCTREDVDFTEDLADYEIKFLGTAVTDPEKLSEQEDMALADENYEMLSIGQKADTGEIGLFLSIGRSIFTVTVEEIKRVLSTI